MKPKPHLVLKMCIKEGIDFGLDRARQNSVVGHLADHVIKQEIETAILREIYEWFDMEVGDDTV